MEECNLSSGHLLNDQPPLAGTVLYLAMPAMKKRRSTAKKMGGPMPSFVITEKCDGCMGQDKTACMYICPHDLMALTSDTHKGINQEPEQCWECYNCVKICPQQAIEIRCYADLAPLGGSVIPMMGSDTIMWTVKFRNGHLKRFKFPNRTVAAGQVDIYPDSSTGDVSKIKEPGFFTHQARGDTLPTLSSNL